MVRAIFSSSSSESRTISSQWKQAKKRIVSKTFLIKEIFTMVICFGRRRKTLVRVVLSSFSRLRGGIINFFSQNLDRNRENLCPIGWESFAEIVNFQSNVLDQIFQVSQDRVSFEIWLQIWAEENSILQYSEAQQKQQNFSFNLPQPQFWDYLFRLSNYKQCWTNRKKSFSKAELANPLFFQKYCLIKLLFR